MSDLTLRFGLEDDRNADALIAAESLAAWVHYVTEAAKAIDPSDRVSVKLVGLQEGSLKFSQILKKLDQTLGEIDAGASEYPHLKVRAIAIAASVGGVTVTHIDANIFPAPPQTVELSAMDRALLENMAQKVESSSSAQQASRRFLESVERDPAVSEVTVGDDEHERLVIVPRSNFPSRGSLWQVENAPPSERLARDVWDVVLLKASFVNRPARWTFLRDGLPFSAKMDDRDFLAAIRDGRVPIALQEGVMMKLEIEFKEQQDGQVWKALDKTRRITRVINPQPLASPLAVADRPKKSNQAK